MNPTPKSLRLTFHGRIIDHLGIQMYQKPVAAIAEMISNAWDADSETVHVWLPENLDDDAQFVIKDDGIGMTFKDCQDRYLNVGLARRGDNPDEKSPEKGRPILGRKGLGKFAGFGIAEILRVETVSKQTGEKTIFEMDINVLRGDEYVHEGGEISVVEYLEPDDDRKKENGTTVILKSLKLKRRPSPDQFPRSMARRFLLHQQVADFQVFLNDQPLPETEQTETEFSFPRDYQAEEKPTGLTLEGDWGVETINGRQIKWRILFFRNPIEEDELRGVAVFAKGKLAQAPFFFNLFGGLGGQHGQEYLSGQVQANFIDTLQEDLIAPERQRVNWEHPEVLPLELWGQDRVKTLLRIWRNRRGERRRQMIEQRTATFTERLERLQPHERRTVKAALNKVASVPALSDSEFQDMAQSFLTGWEQGRLRGLIDELSQQENITAESLLTLLMEADVLVALNLMESVRTKIDAIRGLRGLVEQGELENAVRNYIAEKPYLIDPKWDTFKVEVAVKHMLREAANDVGFFSDEFRGRIDLALRSNENLLIVEFIRPGKKVDWDHLNRCTRYVIRIRAQVEAETQLGISRVTGLIVADALDDAPDVKTQIMELQKSDIYAFSWNTLLSQAEKTWKEFMDIVAERTPEDVRMRALTVENK